MDYNKYQLTILITGRVQAVFFRSGVKTLADELELTGRAENLSDGSLQIVAEGSKEKLQKLLDWCYQGTIFSKVESLKFIWASASGLFKNFEVVKQGNFLEDKLFALKNFSQRVLKKLILPEHVVIIPDGNRRWAKGHKLQIFKGHEKGVRNFTDLLEESRRLKIPYLTFWGFSTENWNRSKTEVSFLMNIFRRHLRKLKEKLTEYKIQFRHFGRQDRLPKDIITSLKTLEAETKDFGTLHLGLALDYGGRDEILRALERCKSENGKVNEADFAKSLDTNGFPDPDLIIRTSGEQRLSGIMPWQGVYAELYFSPRFFPDFDVLEFRKAIADFSNRKRNFGA